MRVRLHMLGHEQSLQSITVAKARVRALWPGVRFVDDGTRVTAREGDRTRAVIERASKAQCGATVVSVLSPARARRSAQSQS